MPEKTGIEQVVEKAVSEAMEAHVGQLRIELVRRVVEQVGPQLGGSPEGTPAGLLKAVSAIQTGTTQREILRALLDNTSRYCGRTALFVVKGGAATGWQGRAFANFEEIKDFALDVSSGVAARALQSRMAFAGGTGEIDAKFVAHFGAPTEDHVFVLPLLLKDRVAALIYADGGTEAGGKIDNAALELLVVSASAWLEVAALRKQAHKEGAAEPAAEAQPAVEAPVHAAPSFSDPFAAHAPIHSAPKPAAIPVEPAAETVMVAEAPALSAAAVAVAPAPDALASLSPEDAEVHRKAQRFARLLVDEIKLYNQAKVIEGRKNRDLYDRLKEDIDKSNATYQKRYGGSVASDKDYFNHELVRSLAEDDRSLMGANFQR